jgi:eukaryotic-like serine/threonine-protein kinase
LPDGRPPLTLTANFSRSPAIRYADSLLLSGETSLLEPGQIFASRYRVRRCIAEGGMGAIFEAEHTATERRVALKLLFPHIMSVGNAREKFELEAKISARVNSRYIVEVLDAGFDEATKSPFLVMELLDGQTLARHVAEQGPLAIDPALRLLEQVAAGLDAAHGYREPGGIAKPIVHRDLKPENLFLARQHDGSVVAKILDFGIAKVLGDTANISQEVRGTPLFMAFEQITAAPLSPQTDVWAYGLIAYYTLTGARYWRSTERQGASVQALFAEILNLPLEAPSVRLREQNVDIELPAAFDAWLLRCIDRTPTQRFPSAGAAAEALARVFERAPRSGSKPLSDRVLAPSRTETFVGLQPPALASTGSLPALATTKHRRPVSSSAAASKPVNWMAAVAAGGALLLGAIIWLAAREDEPTASGMKPAARAPAPESASAEPPAAGPTALPRPSASPSVATPPAATAGDSRAAASDAPSAAEASMPIAPEPRLQRLPEPRIRIAPPDQTSPPRGDSARRAAPRRAPSSTLDSTSALERTRAATASLSSNSTPAPAAPENPGAGVEPASPPASDAARTSGGLAAPNSDAAHSGPEQAAAPAPDGAPKKKKTRKQRPGQGEAYKYRR